MPSLRGLQGRGNPVVPLDVTEISGLPRRLCLLATTRVFRPCGTEFKNAVIARPAGPWQSSCAAGCNGNLWIATSALLLRNDDAGVLSNKLTNNLD